MQSVNPATGEVVRSYPDHTADEVRAIVAEAAAAQKAWAAKSFEERARVLHAAAGVFRERAEDLARLAAVEMGKPMSQGVAEAEKCGWVYDYYAEHGAEFLAPEHVDTGATASYVAFKPLGILLAVMPWNYPMWQVVRAAAPALMAGNGVVLKHASNVPGTAVMMEEILVEAGLPHRVFSTLLIGSSMVDDLIAMPEIAAVTITGSNQAGIAVATAAGANIKKSVLELGGSDPSVVLADADLDVAAASCAAGRLLNSGQSCIASKRFIVVPEVREAFEQKLAANLAAQIVGDPLDPATQVGPMARDDLRDELHDQVTRSVEAGARVLIGGEMPEGPGSFYPPTVLTDVGPGMAAYHEELFGPVAAIIPVADEEEACRVANDTEFGLGASIYTRDLEKGRYLAEHVIEAGSVFVNDFVRSDPRLPFGGVKESGYGRELSHYGIREFVNIKTVYIR